MGWFKWVPVIGQIAQGIAWAVQTIKARKKGKFTPEEREQATKEAKERADRIIADVEKARGK